MNLVITFSLKKTEPLFIEGLRSQIYSRNQDHHHPLPPTCRSVRHMSSLCARVGDHHHQPFEAAALLYLHHATHIHTRTAFRFIFSFQRNIPFRVSLIVSTSISCCLRARKLLGRCVNAFSMKGEREEAREGTKGANRLDRQNPLGGLTIGDRVESGNGRNGGA